MHRIFLPLYRYFQRNKAVMWTLLIASSLVFAWFGSKLRYEEDIIKLLPRSSTSNELAFSDIGLVDKIFVQVTSADTLHPLPPFELAQVMDGYCDMIQEKDSSSHYIKGLLYNMDMNSMLGAIDFGITHLPSFVDTSWYGAIASALTPEAIEAQMKENYYLMMEDETGDDTQMVAMDPLNLRTVLLEKILGGNANMGGLAIEDGHLFCPDKTVALAFVSPSFSSTDSGSSTRMVKMMERTREEILAQHPDVRIFIHGNPPGSVSNSGTIKLDLVWSIGLSLVLILVIMLLSFHNLTFLWQQVLPVLYGSVFSLACMYWIKGYMSLMALGISAIVLGVAISYCLHVLIHFYYVGNAEKMLEEESTPVFLGCLTTIGAFMGLLMTESDLLRDFGLFATFALLGNTFFALVFLPHFMSPKQIRYKRTHGFPLVEKINNLPWDRNKWVIGTLIAVIVVGVAFSPRVKFDSDLRNLDYDNEELRTGEKLYNSKTSDGYAHQYFAAWDDDLDQALDYNRNLAVFLDSLQAEGCIHAYVPVGSMLLHSTATQQQRIDAWKAFWSPSRVKELRRNMLASARRNGVPEYIFDGFLNMIGQDYEPASLVEAGVIPPGLLSNYAERQESGRYMVYTDVSYEKSQTEDVWKKITSREHILVLEPFYYCRDMVEIVHDDFSTTLWISSIFVLLVLLLSFHNIWISLIAFLPMFLSWYVMQGYMAILGLEFNLINIVISTFIYGIGVDYSIFVMEGLLAEARRGDTSMLAFHKVAIFYSALVLAIVTFSLIFARHPAIHSIGLITLIGMASTILITYSLQPWIFRKLLKIPFFRKTFRIPE